MVGVRRWWGSGMGYRSCGGLGWWGSGGGRGLGVVGV